MTVENIPKIYDINERGRSSCQYYVAFCTKFNRRVFTDGYEKKLGDIMEGMDMPEGTVFLDVIIEPDAVQCIVKCPPDVSVQKCINGIKASVARKLHEDCPELKTRMPQIWTKRNFVSSMGDVTVNAVCDFISSQRKE